MKVLVTGGAGYIGTELVSLLALNPKLSVAQVIDPIQRGAEKTPDGRINLMNPRKSVELLKAAKSS